MTPGGNNQPASRVPTEPAAPPATGLDAACFLLAWLPYAILAKLFWFITDDGYISFTYSKHLAEGLGLRFNPGESPPIEGYSNLLWVLWCAIPEALGLDVAIWSTATTFLCGTAVLWLVYRTLRISLDSPRWIATGATASLSLFPPFFVWASGGLETMVFVLFALSTFQSLLFRGDGARATSWGVVSAAALVLVRVEGVAWAVLLCLGAGALRRLDGRPLRPVLTTVAGFGLVFVCHLLWRHSYHDAWVSNTAMAKVGLSVPVLLRGLTYVGSYLAELVVPLVTLPAALVALVTLQGPRRWLALVVFGYVAVTVGYAIVVGGDWMTMGRLFAPGWPFAALLLGLALRELPARVAAVALAVTLAISPLPAKHKHLTPQALREQLNVRAARARYWPEIVFQFVMHDDAKRWTDMALALRDALPPDASVVAGAVGCLGYFSGLTIHDQNGLVDREVASRPVQDLRLPGHDKFAPMPFFLPRNPEIMFAFFARSEEERDRRIEGLYVGFERHADTMPKVLARYTVRSQAARGGYLVVLARNDIHIGEPVPAP